MSKPKLSVVKISTGETLIGEIVKSSWGSEDYLQIEYPFTINQHPSANDSGGYGEMILLFPYLYKFAENGTVRIRRDSLITEPAPANEIFTKLYSLNFIKQTLHDLRQAEAIDTLHAEYFNNQTKRVFH